MENRATRNSISLNAYGVVQMNFQKIYQSSENMAVAVGVTIFIVFHFGMLFLFEMV